jgi:primosomal protein N' (replication factor Y)
VLIDVALPLPLFREFTYESEAPIAAGSRVVVPLRGSRVIGIALGAHEGDSAVKTRRVLDVPDAEPALAPHVLALCKWIAEYYVVPLGVVVRSALPAALLGADAPRPAPKVQRVARIGLRACEATAGSV